MSMCPCCGYDPDRKDELFVCVSERAMVYRGKQVINLRRHVVQLADLLKSGRWLERDYLITTIWGDDEPEHVEKCLYVALTQLRKALNKLGDVFILKCAYGQAKWKLFKSSPMS